MIGQDLKKVLIGDFYFVKKILQYTWISEIGRNECIDESYKAGVSLTTLLWWVVKVRLKMKVNGWGEYMQRRTCIGEEKEEVEV